MMAIPKTSYEFFIWYGANSMLNSNSRQRSGQFLFNSLLKFRPDIAEKIRGTDVDPFYTDDRLDTACAWIDANW